MPVCPWPLFLRRVTLAKIEVYPLEQKHRAKTVRGGLGAACVLAVVCVAFLPAGALAQDASSKTSPAKTTGGTKAASPKKRAKAAASGSKASSSSSAKAHPASHPAADKRPKSNTAVIAHNTKGKHASARRKKTTARGQQKIDPERSQAIQEALIREHYMTGEATGTWNQTSEDAMRRYQADHGWQSKTVPDSRALISLGLGPSHDHLLNPESAMITGPFPPRAASLTPASHSADPGARLNASPARSADPAQSTSPDHDASGPQ